MTVPTSLGAEPSNLEKRVVGTLVRALFFRGRRGGPWPVPDSLPHAAVRFVGNSGARLAGLHFPAANSQGTVVLAHPDRRYAKHWFIRHGWVEWLTANGLDVLVFDFPVYGESSGGSTYLHDDVAAACHEAQRLRPDLPVHLVGLSIGAFASINAGRTIPFVESLVLESPYPTFESWYEHAATQTTEGQRNRLLGRLFPRTYRRIDAGANIAHHPARRILIAGTPDDEVTAIALTRQVAAKAPADRTTYREFPGHAHLGLFADPAYRTAILETLLGPPAKRGATAAGILARA